MGNFKQGTKIRLKDIYCYTINSILIDALFIIQQKKGYLIAGRYREGYKGVLSIGGWWASEKYFEFYYDTNNIVVKGEYK